ncbi:hypothetical protein M405DRAFT_822637 [Rhizopogon salebrosus TDB-379]|nr:hypothetical protein M405DRAFT_822637 [Rhizopogon salebrosus TDB-379]
MTNGIIPPSGLDRHCASSSSSQFLPHRTLSILLAFILLLAITNLLILETAHCISMLLPCCACEGEASFIERGVRSRMDKRF